jgi:hypothetical protein
VDLWRAVKLADDLCSHPVKGPKRGRRVPPRGDESGLNNQFNCFFFKHFNDCLVLDLATRWIITTREITITNLDFIIFHLLFVSSSFID